MFRACAAVAMAFCLLAGGAEAQNLLNEHVHMGSPETRTIRYTFENPGVAAKVRIEGRLIEGRGSFLVKDPDGNAVLTMDLPKGKMQSAVGVPADKPGTWTAELSLQDATGTLTVSAPQVVDKSFFRVMLPSGPLMILVALAAVWIWRRRARIQFRWFWVGAAVWAVGVALKFAWALPLNDFILTRLFTSVPWTVYLALGSLYIGLLTGVFEIGVTWLAARIWPRMASTAGRGVAVGVGAGAFEALMVGIVTTASAVVLAFVDNVPDDARAMTAAQAAGTGVLWLVGPVERVLAILCHVASRALVLLGIVQRRGILFWYGFLLLTAIDAIAGFAHLSLLIGEISAWWIELAIAPFAVASAFIIPWCVRHWPTEADSEAPPAPETADAVPV